VRTPAGVVFCTMLLTGAAQAQAPAPVDSAAVSTVQSTVIGRWVLDSTPTRKNRRQTYLAAISASDTVVGEFKATRPILKLYCHNNARQVDLEIFVGQQIHGSLPYLTSGPNVRLARGIHRASHPARQPTGAEGQMAV
jgi:hypothetical protein